MDFVKMVVSGWRGIQWGIFMHEFDLQFTMGFRKLDHIWPHNSGHINISVKTKLRKQKRIEKRFAQFMLNKAKTYVEA